MSKVRRELAHAKLTLSLRVVGRRPDGYHLLSAEMVTLDLADELELAPGEGIEVLDAVAWTGQAVPAPAIPAPATPAPAAPAPVSRVPDGPGNLVVRALRLAGVSAHVRLTKRIPAGGGLGGGSADAAAVLRWAGFSDLEKAASLGADVPFCLVGGRARVEGIGERVTSLAEEPATYLLCSPPFGVATALVYQAYDDLATGRGRPGRSGPNDLEAAALAVEPRLARWRDLLASATGRTPMLAGSGSTWYVEVGESDAEGSRDACQDLVGRSGEHAMVVVARTAGRQAQPDPFKG